MSTRYDEIREQEERTKEHYEYMRDREIAGQQAPDHKHKAVRG